MKWRVEIDEWYPVFSIHPLTAECSPEIDLTEEEVLQVKQATDAFNKAQELIRSKAEAAGRLLDWRKYFRETEP